MSKRVLSVMRPNALAFIVALFTNTLLFGQQQRSLLYTNTFKLRKDTLFHISEEQFKKWSKGEGFIINEIAVNIRFPSLAQEFNIQGTVILSFECDSSRTIKNIKVVKKLAAPADSAGIAAIYASQRVITEYLKEEGEIKSTYYVPVTFDFMFDEISKYKAIPVKIIHIPHFEHCR